MKPKRIQLIRRKGWRKPENAVVVSRPTRWGNPWKVGDLSQKGFVIKTRGMAAQEFKKWLHNTPEGERMQLYAQKELRGKDLACWCPLDKECHADALLAVANW